MSVKAEPELAGVVVPEYGEYLGKYESDHAEASAHLFRKGTALRAYLSYKKGMLTHHFIDDYIEDLRRIAKEHDLSLEILHVA